MSVVFEIFVKIIGKFQQSLGIVNTHYYTVIHNIHALKL